MVTYSTNKTPKNVLLHFRVNEAEAKTIEECAERMKLPISSYMRSIVVRDAEKRNYLAELEDSRKKKG